MSSLLKGKREGRLSSWGKRAGGTKWGLKGGKKISLGPTLRGNKKEGARPGSFCEGSSLGKKVCKGSLVPV